MICFNGSDLISLKANNGLLQPRLQDDDDDDDDDDENRTRSTQYRPKHSSSIQ